MRLHTNFPQFVVRLEPQKAYLCEKFQQSQTRTTRHSAVRTHQRGCRSGTRRVVRGNVRGRGLPAAPLRGCAALIRSYGYDASRHIPNKHQSGIDYQDRRRAQASAYRPRRHPIRAGGNPSARSEPRTRRPRMWAHARRCAQPPPPPHLFSIQRES